MRKNEDQKCHFGLLEQERASQLKHAELSRDKGCSWLLPCPRLQLL